MVMSLIFALAIPIYLTVISPFFIEYEDYEIVKSISNASLLFGMLLGQIMIGMQIKYGMSKPKPVPAERFLLKKGGLHKMFINIIDELLIR